MVLHLEVERKRIFTYGRCCGLQLEVESWGSNGSTRTAREQGEIDAVGIEGAIGLLHEVAGSMGDGAHIGVTEFGFQVVQPLPVFSIPNFVRPQ